MKRIFRASRIGGCIWNIFSRLQSIMGWVCPPIPSEFFMNHVTIFNSSPMQHLRWNSLWRKISNGWKLLLAFVTWSFFVNVVGLLNKTLKCIDEFRAKNARTTCQIYSKLIKPQNDASIVNFELISHFVLL